MTAPEGLRLFPRLILTVVFSALMFVLAALTRLLMLWKSNGFYRPLCILTSKWGHGIALIWGMRIDVKGPRPPHPFYLVCNHMSYTDVIVLCAVCPAWFVSKAEISSWPGVGALTRMALTLFINRENRRDVARINTMIADLVRHGGSVMFFPEGTTSDGSTIAPFKPSLLQPAVDLDIPVHVAVLSYTTPENSPPPEDRIIWINDAPFAPHATRLLSSRGFTAHLRFASKPVQAPDRKHLSHNARDTMIHLHQTLREEIA